MLARRPVIVCVIDVRMLIMSACVRTMKSLSSLGARRCSSRRTEVMSSATRSMSSADAAEIVISEMLVPSRPRSFLLTVV